MRYVKKKIGLIVGFVTMMIAFVCFGVAYLKPQSRDFVTAYAEEVESEKMSNEEINDDFEDNSVIVVFTREETLQFKDYSVEDFKEVEAEEKQEILPRLIAAAKF